MVKSRQTPGCQVPAATFWPTGSVVYNHCSLPDKVPVDSSEPVNLLSCWMDILHFYTRSYSSLHPVLLLCCTNRAALRSTRQTFSSYSSYSLQKEKLHTFTQSWRQTCDELVACWGGVRAGWEWHTNSTRGMSGLKNVGMKVTQLRNIYSYTEAQKKWKFSHLFSKVSLHW